MANKSRQTQDRSQYDETPKIAIIGAGIAGLYCAYKLKEKHPDILIAEETDHFGGRIWTTRILNQGGNSLADSAEDPSAGASNQIEFTAEFGPMRLELQLQRLLRQLLTELEFKEEDDFEGFPPYESPVSTHDPKYEMHGEEVEQATPFDLLILAVLRIFGRISVKSTDRRATQLSEKLQQVMDSLSRASATRQPAWQAIFRHWVEELDEMDYQNLREFAIFDDGTKSGTPLWEMGFWNLLSEVLSHHAVMRIRDLGTFYHLIPENPNAAEWLIFWLRGLRTSEDMIGIRGGMRKITEAIVRKIGDDKIRTGHKLIGLHPISDGAVELTFANGKTWRAERVILALPKAPLEELARLNASVFSPEFFSDLDSVFSFPMVKLFIVVKEKFWEQDRARTNKYATVIPSREIHYKSSSLPGSKKGMILLYTDRPATSFWANYVKKLGEQHEPEVGNTRNNERLVQRCVKYLKEYGVSNIKPEDVLFYGLRDWGRKPYDGANHSWRPERRSWEVLRRLSGFRIGPAPAKSEANIHVCGEAYSDYHGFIEGSLRSAAHVLHRINPRLYPTETGWICDEPRCKH